MAASSLFSGPCSGLDTYFETLYGDTEVLELCALAAEKLEADDLAAFFATHGTLEGFYAVKTEPRAGCRAILGRIAMAGNAPRQRQQDGNPPSLETGAAWRGHLRAAAEDLLANATKPILVVWIAGDWRGRGR